MHRPLVDDETADALAPVIQEGRLFFWGFRQNIASSGPCRSDPRRVGSGCTALCEQELLVHRVLKSAATIVVALTFIGTAQAMPPALKSVGQQARHPTARFFAPRADTVLAYVASKPDRGANGSFLAENVEEIDSLTALEIHTGSWLHEQQLDPGTHFVMVRAYADFDTCYLFGTGGYRPACAEGFSAMAALVIPKPASKYSVSVQRYSLRTQFSFILTAAPLGEERPYRLCYRLKTNRRVCLRRTLNGFDWGNYATDSLTVPTRNLARLTTFTWYVGNTLIARRTLRR